MIELVVRLVFSLAVVVGMLLLLAKFSAKRFRGGSGSLVQVVQRQPLSRTSSVAVVTVGSRVLVLGTTEQQVQLLTELDPDELDVPAPDAPEDPPSDRRSAMAHSQSDEAPAVRRLGRPKRQPKPRLVSQSAPQSVPTMRDADVVAAEGALSGSVLSAQTWKQAFAAATSAATSAPPGRHRAAS